MHTCDMEGAGNLAGLDAAPLKGYSQQQDSIDNESGSANVCVK